MTKQKLSGMTTSTKQEIFNPPFNSIIVAPCVFVALLEQDKYYVAITHSFNLTIAKWKNGTGPQWTRSYRFLKILEMHTSGSLSCIKEVTARWMLDKGQENVRSSIPGHTVNNSKPGFFLSFLKLKESANDEESGS